MSAGSLVKHLTTCAAASAASAQRRLRVTLTCGDVRNVEYAAGSVILLIQQSCEYMGVPYVLEAFNWPSPEAGHVCIRTLDGKNTAFRNVTSADYLSDLNDAEVEIQAALRAFQRSEHEAAEQAVMAA